MTAISTCFEWQHTATTHATRGAWHQCATCAVHVEACAFLQVSFQLVQNTLAPSFITTHCKCLHTLKRWRLVKKKLPMEGTLLFRLHIKKRLHFKAELMVLFSVFRRCYVQGEWSGYTVFLGSFRWISSDVWCALSSLLDCFKYCLVQTWDAPHQERIDQTRGVRECPLTWCGQFFFFVVSLVAIAIIVICSIVFLTYYTFPPFSSKKISLVLEFLDLSNRIYEVISLCVLPTCVLYSRWRRSVIFGVLSQYTNQNSYLPWVSLGSSCQIRLCSHSWSIWHIGSSHWIRKDRISETCYTVPCSTCSVCVISTLLKVILNLFFLCCFFFSLFHSLSYSNTSNYHLNFSSPLHFFFPPSLHALFCSRMDFNFLSFI